MSDKLKRTISEKGSNLELTGTITYPADMHKEVGPLAEKFKQLFEWCLSWGKQGTLDLTVIPTVMIQKALVRSDKPSTKKSDYQFTVTGLKVKPEDQNAVFAAMDAGIECEVIVRMPDKPKAVAK